MAAGTVIPTRFAWAAAALVAAAYLGYVAVGLFMHVTDAGCDELFSECIRLRQQYLRGALGCVAAASAVAALFAAFRLSTGRAGPWRAVITVAVLIALLFAAVQPETHLDNRTEWLGP